MLLNLLPGVRDIRVPLSAGILWLLAAYLAIAPHVPEPDEATGALSTIYNLAGYLGSGPTIAAVLFTAYVIGILQPSILSHGRWWSTPSAIAASIRLWRQRRRRRRERGTGPQPFVRLPADKETTRRVGIQTATELTLRVEPLIRRATTREDRLKVLEAALGGPPDGAEDSPLHEDSVRLTVMSALMDEQGALAEKLRIQDKERLWLSYDQKISEGEFRKAISAPLLALIIVLAFTGSWWFAFVAPVPVLLHRQGEAKEREARSELYQALLHEIINSQVLQSVAEATAPAQVW